MRRRGDEHMPGPRRSPRGRPAADFAAARRSSRRRLSAPARSASVFGDRARRRGRVRARRARARALVERAASMVGGRRRRPRAARAMPMPRRVRARSADRRGAYPPACETMSPSAATARSRLTRVCSAAFALRGAPRPRARRRWRRRRRCRRSRAAQRASVATSALASAPGGSTSAPVRSSMTIGPSTPTRGRAGSVGVHAHEPTRGHASHGSIRLASVRRSADAHKQHGLTISDEQPRLLI